MADGERRLHLGPREERVRMAIPPRPHDATRQAELDVIHAGLYVLANGSDELLGAVARQGESGTQGVASRRGDEPASGEQPRAEVLPGVEGALERHVDEVRRARHAHARDAGVGERALSVGQVLRGEFGARQRAGCAATRDARAHPRDRGVRIAPGHR
jgi:hypothetical protein